MKQSHKTEANTESTKNSSSIHTKPMPRQQTNNELAETFTQSRSQENKTQKQIADTFTQNRCQDNKQKRHS